MKTTALITAAVALVAALVGAAMATPADTTLTLPVPQATGRSVAPDDSGDQRLRIIAAGYSRAMLDRGGWSNAWMSGDHYAAGEPLRAVAVGNGLTTRFATNVADRSSSPRTVAVGSRRSDGS